MKSKRSNPEERESVAFRLAKIASRPPCFLDFVRFLPPDCEVFDASVMLKVWFVCEIADLYFGTDDGDVEILIRVFLPQDSHL